jgi:hypothetical protein
MDWFDQYLTGMGEYKVTVSPADTHQWGTHKPSKQQQSLIQDSMAFDVQQMRLIQEARAALETHGGAPDPGSTPFGSEAPVNPPYAANLCVRAIDASNTFGMSGRYAAFNLSDFKGPNDSNFAFRLSTPINNPLYGVPSYFKYDTVSTHWYWTSGRTDTTKIFENMSVGQVAPTVGIFGSSLSNVSPPLRNWVCNVAPSASYVLDYSILRGVCPGSY